MTPATRTGVPVGPNDITSDATAPTDASPNCPCSDALVLMRRLAAGESAAMNELITDHGPALHRLVGRLTGWAHDADDIMQDILIQVWHKAGQYRGEGSLEGWLRRVAINTCHSKQRGLRRFARRLRAARYLDSLPAAEPPAPTTHEESLATALGQLSQTDRSALVLFYMEDLPGEEVAAALGIRVGALHTRLSRARARLRELMPSAHPTPTGRE